MNGQKEVSQLNLTKDGNNSTKDGMNKIQTNYNPIWKYNIGMFYDHKNKKYYTQLTLEKINKTNKKRADR